MPFWERHITLIRVEGTDVKYVQNKGDKHDMLRTAMDALRHGNVLYLIAWTGQYTTDIFHVTIADVENWLKGER
jgi:hypothetical protein